MNDLQVMPRPCQNCPFSKKQPGFLGKARATEIAEGLNHGESFSCHKTLDYKDGNGRAISGVTVMCAGAALLLENIDKPNQLMQLAQRLGIMMAKVFYQSPEGKEEAFENFQDFIDHHS